ncbi:MAG: nucleotidyltransferase domain-containing protein [Oscillospiraceae bacterium]|nr:nucleotidyltransferase domain-containing protein [Oscillospiraceae bacterium]
MTTILTTIRREAENIFGDKLVDVILYGSYARGDYNNDSDIDIMIKVSVEKANMYPYRLQMSRVASRLGLEHDIVVSTHLQDNSLFEKYRHIMPFYQNVTNEGVAV